MIKLTEKQLKEIIELLKCSSQLITSLTEETGVMTVEIDNEIKKLESKLEKAAS
jgi:hypothetical protein